MARYNQKSSSSLPLILFLLFIFGVITYAVFNYIPENIEKTRAGVTGALTKDDVRGIVRDELQKNPEVLLKALESLSAYQEKQQREEQEKGKANLQSNLKQMEDTANTPFAGNPKGDVTIVVFSDYSCGYCKRAAGPLMEVLKSDPNVKVIFREFPILGPMSLKAAQLALGVHKVEPAKYVEVHAALMAAPHFTSEDALLDVIKKTGVDIEKVKQAADKAEITAEITANRNLARSVSIQGTPAFIFNGDLVPGALDAAGMKAKVAEARARAKNAPKAAEPAKDAGKKAEAVKEEKPAKKPAAKPSAKEEESANEPAGEAVDSIPPAE